MMGMQDRIDSESLRRRREEELATIRQRLNAMAASLAPKLLPNGRKAGPYWETANIRDEKTGSYSLKVHISGARCGSWSDYGVPRGQPGGGGDMFTLLCEREHGGDFVAAVKDARRITGMDNLSEAEFREAQRRSAEAAAAAAAAETEEQAKWRGRAESLWHGAVPIAGDGWTAAAQYLAGRGIDLQRMGRVPGALRYHPAVWNSEVAENRGRAHAKVPAMLGCIVGLDGRFLGVHRTWLDVSGGKAGPVGKLRGVEDAKKTLGQSLGGHIPLWKGAHRATLRDIAPGTAVHMSEGIEDGLSIAVADPSLRVIAGVALSKMGQVELPEQMGDLVLIGQNDPIGGQAVESLETVIGQQQARLDSFGRGAKVRLMFPPAGYKDFNDMLCGKRIGG